MKFASAIWAGLLAALLASAASAAQISGAGATFPYPIYAQWATAYKAETGIAVNYQAIGSGLGIKLIKQKAVTFGASDMPLKPAELDAAGLIQFPTIVGGDVPVVNIKGIAPGAMVLDGPTLANIFLGKITRWNDPAIAKLNPGLQLPELAISVVHRADGSGTTFIWTDYLAKQSAQWHDEVGLGTLVAWPTGLGAAGNEGVSAHVARVNGAIGYVEFAYALQNHLAYAKMINKAGKPVSPSLETFRAAADSADWKAAPRFYLILTDLPGADTWPIAGASFILMRKQPKDAAASAEALKFFRWAYEKGGDMALGLSYVPLPKPATDEIKASWTQIQSASH